MTAHLVGVDSILVAGVGDNNATTEINLSEIKRQLLWQLQAVQFARGELTQ